MRLKYMLVVRSNGRIVDRSYTPLTEYMANKIQPTWKKQYESKEGVLTPTRRRRFRGKITVDIVPFVESKPKRRPTKKSKVCGCEFCQENRKKLY